MKIFSNFRKNFMIFFKNEYTFFFIMGTFLTLIYPISNMDVKNENDLFVKEAIIFIWATCLLFYFLLYKIFTNKNEIIALIIGFMLDLLGKLIEYLFINCTRIGNLNSFILDNIMTDVAAYFLDLWYAFALIINNGVDKLKIWYDNVPTLYFGKKHLIKNIFRFIIYIFFMFTGILIGILSENNIIVLFRNMFKVPTYDFKDKTKYMYTPFWIKVLSIMFIEICIFEGLVFPVRTFILFNLPDDPINFHYGRNSIMFWKNPNIKKIYNFFRIFVITGIPIFFSEITQYIVKDYDILIKLINDETKRDDINTCNIYMFIFSVTVLSLFLIFMIIFLLISREKGFLHHIKKIRNKILK